MGDIECLAIGLADTVNENNVNFCGLYFMYFLFDTHFALMKYLKERMPIWIPRIMKFVIHGINLFSCSFYWIKHDLLYSSDSKTKEGQLTGLMITSHVLEKGITMPNRRLGFGYSRVRRIIYQCNDCIDKYGYESVEVQSTLDDLYEYLHIHESSNFQLPEDIDAGIRLLINQTHFAGNSFSSIMSKDDYFKPVVGFEQLAYQRHSIRNYVNKEIEMDIIYKVLRLAQTAPSACNRQSVRVKVISDKMKKEAVLNLQNGNRGFGHLADKILLITSEQGAWSYKTRTSAYLDAGIYTMNLLYALHYYKLCACTLNCHLSVNEMKKLRKILDIPTSELPIVFISVGYAPERFIIAKSQRLDVEQIVTII